jgi:hypothetical protein
MQCQDARKWISPYLDSELDPTKTFEVSQHLESCAPCRSRFEKEARADELIGAALRREESYVDWPAIERQVLAPARRIIPFRPKWLLAAAACIAIILVIPGVWPGSTVAADPAQWAVDELHELSPDCSPFPEGPGCTPSDVDEMTQAALDCRIGIPISDDGSLGGHPLTLIQRYKRTCAGGTDRVEIQLNCCGKPVLLIVGKCTKQGIMRNLVAELDKSNGKYEGRLSAHNHEYHVRAHRKGKYVVLAVSPHPIDHLVGNVVPTVD